MTHDWIIREGAICLHCGGRFCNNAHLPIAGHGYQRLLAQGVPEDSFEWRGYRAVRTHGDCPCIFCNSSRCSIHSIRPETCRAGPFTFDGKGDVIEIFLKYQAVCPVVRLLKNVPAACEYQFALAKKNIAHLAANLKDGGPRAIRRIEEPETIEGGPR